MATTAEDEEEGRRRFLLRGSRRGRRGVGGRVAEEPRGCHRAGELGLVPTSASPQSRPSRRRRSRRVTCAPSPSRATSRAGRTEPAGTPPTRIATGFEPPTSGSPRTRLTDRPPSRRPSARRRDRTRCTTATGSSSRDSTTYSDRRRTCSTRTRRRVCTRTSGSFPVGQRVHHVPLPVVVPRFSPRSRRAGGDEGAGREGEETGQGRQEGRTNAERRPRARGQVVEGRARAREARGHGAIAAAGGYRARTAADADFGRLPRGSPAPHRRRVTVASTRATGVGIRPRPVSPNGSETSSPRARPPSGGGGGVPRRRVRLLLDAVRERHVRDEPRRRRAHQRRRLRARAYETMRTYVFFARCYHWTAWFLDLFTDPIFGQLYAFVLRVAAARVAWASELVPVPGGARRVVQALTSGLGPDRGPSRCRIRRDSWRDS